MYKTEQQNPFLQDLPQENYLTEVILCTFHQLEIQNPQLATQLICTSNFWMFSENPIDLFAIPHLDMKDYFGTGEHAKIVHYSLKKEN